MRQSLFSIRWFQQGLTCLSLSLCFHTVAVTGLSLYVLRARSNVAGEALVLDFALGQAETDQTAEFRAIESNVPEPVADSPVETEVVLPSTPTVVRKPIAQPEPSPVQVPETATEPKIKSEPEPVEVVKKVRAENENRASLADFAAAIKSQPRTGGGGARATSPVGLQALEIPDTPRESVVFRRPKRENSPTEMAEIEETPVVPQAQFFGVQAEGKKFAFVVDCSVSMTGPKWISARRELIRSLEALSDDQQFFVVFFDGHMHRMPVISKESAGFSSIEVMPFATEENIATLKGWMKRVRLGPDTRPSGSVREAFHQNPDAIFFLSDGAFADQTLTFLRDANQTPGEPPKVPVHTISFERGRGAVLLKRMSDENGGKFQAVWR